MEGELSSWKSHLRVDEVRTKAHAPSVDDRRSSSQHPIEDHHEPSAAQAAVHGLEQHVSPVNGAAFGRRPTYVNAKQYNRIVKRREERLKLETLWKISHERKTYLHESRHKHACRRKRGPGGRFLTKAELAAQEAEEQRRGGHPLPPRQASTSEDLAANAMIAVRQGHFEPERLLFTTTSDAKRLRDAAALAGCI